MNKEEYGDLVTAVIRYMGDDLDLTESQLIKMCTYIERLTKVSQKNDLFIASGVDILYHLYSFD